MQHYELQTNVSGETGTMTVYAPFDGAPIATVATATAQHIEHGLATALDLYRNKSGWLTVHQRVTILERATQLMADEHEFLVTQSAQEGGKPWMDSKVEVDRAIDGLKLAIETIRHDHGEVIPMGGDAYSANRVAFTQKEPIGVVVAVSAFNHPLNLIVHQVGAAVAAGCPVIVKPAHDTPLSCIHFARILHRAGLPPEWCQCLPIEDVELAGRLVTDERVAFFTFIGSAQVGWMLRSKLAPGTRCALEHGGVAPVLAYADASLDKLIPALLKGGYYHAGQVCVSVQRVFAHSSIVGEIGTQLAALARQLKVGDPTLRDTEVGPLIRPEEVQRVDQWVREAVAAGAECLCGGEAISESCYQPTLLLNPPVDAQVSTTEIFGPVVCLYAYDDMQQAIQIANALPFSFQAAVFTQDMDSAMHAYRHLNASAVMVNEHTAFRIDGMPFAGLNQSGHGVGGIPHSIHEMQIEKMMVIKSSSLA